MKYIKVIGLLMTLTLALGACESEDNNLIVEPAGAAHYYINNQSELTLAIEFVTSVALGSNVDDSFSLDPNSKIQIFSDGIIGVNPMPTNSFQEIKFHAMVDGAKKLVYILSPMVNDRWTIIEKEIPESGYGLTKYELLIETIDLTLD